MEKRSNLIFFARTELNEIEIVLNDESGLCNKVPIQNGELRYVAAREVKKLTVISCRCALKRMSVFFTPWTVHKRTGIYFSRHSALLLLLLRFCEAPGESLKCFQMLSVDVVM